MTGKKRKTTAPPEKAVRILLIEDNPSDVENVRRILPDAFSLSVCGRLDEGMSFLRSNPVDLILLDLSLPDGHGLDVLLRLNARSYSIPILVLTSTDDRLVASIAIKQGAQDYILKETLNADLFVRAIQYALDRKHVELELETQRQNFHSIVEQSDEGIVVVDAYGMVRYFNQAAEEFLGVPGETLLGRSLGPRILSAGTSEIDIRLKNGENGLGEYRVLPTSWRGEAASLILIRDITEQKAAEKMRDDFIQTVSHELRTPLTAIRESVSQLLDGIPGTVNPDQKKNLSLCLRNTDHLKRIVDNLLDLSKYESGRAELRIARFDMAELAVSILDSFRPRAQRNGIILEFDLPETPVFVRADRQKITQVWMNLIDNALKFTRKGFVRIEIREEKEMIICSVSDSGRGIAADSLARIFEKFEQFGKMSPHEEKGTGLGLTISKNIIELHGGAIRAESEPERGSRFLFTLPQNESISQGD